MKKNTDALTMEYKEQARKIVTLTYALCEEKLAASKTKGETSPELKALAASALSVERALITFMAISDSCK